MLRLRFLLTLVLLVCPWVYSYGQLHFASVHGERGYAAMRGVGRLDLDNGLILTPSGGDNGFSRLFRRQSGHRPQYSTAQSSSK